MLLDEIIKSELLIGRLEVVREGEDEIERGREGGKEGGREGKLLVAGIWQQFERTKDVKSAPAGPLMNADWITSRW